MNASWVKMLDKNPKLARLPHSQRREVVDRRMCIVSFYSVARNCTHTLNLVLPCVEMAWRPGSSKAVFVTKAVENGYSIPMYANVQRKIFNAISDVCVIDG